MSRPFLHAFAAALLIALAAGAQAQPSAGRLIVKFREDGARTAAMAVPATDSPEVLTSRLAAAVGTPLAYVRAMALGAHVVHATGVSTDTEARALAAVLAQAPGVEYAEIDGWRQPSLRPNDTYVNLQTYLDVTPTGIGAFGAWDYTTGATSTVVAVVDSGVLPSADLAGRVLPGYDFISLAAVANDGNGRDPDPTDPGDWITQADLDGAFSGDSTCKVHNSSWHGTGVASVIGANSNNQRGIAGIDWAARILPVRVLGKCGGYDSDIADGIAWSGGLHVPGVPDNPAPAHVINLSLGGTGACPTSLQNAIQNVLKATTTRAVVVAAGNENENVATHSPASCAGVIAVAAVNTAGDRASYSNFGSGVALAAPGGDASGRIYVLSDTGTTTPAADAVAGAAGTSFAAPMVSGVVALMLAVAPDLTVAQVRAILTASAKPFPAGSTCATQCGAGIVDARAAVVAARAPAGGGATAPVVEYYNVALDHFFITSIPAEISALDQGAFGGGWQRTGQSFNAWGSAATAPPGAAPVCRVFISYAGGSSHFYSGLANECAAASTVAGAPLFLESPNMMYLLLADAAGGCPAGTRAVYRVWSNRADSNHRFTTDAAIRQLMVAKGWLLEGPGPGFAVMCAPL